MMPENRLPRTHFCVGSRLAVLLMATSLFAGCAMEPLRLQETTILAPVAGSELDQAERLNAGGQVAEASAGYLALAANAPSPAKAQLELKAVRAAISAGEGAAARGIVADIDQTALTDGQRQILALAEADLALIEDNPQEAVRILQPLSPSQLTTAERRKRLGTLATARRLTGDSPGALKALFKLDRMLEGAERLDNQVSILSVLGALSPAERARIARDGSARIDGWIELAELNRGGTASDFASSFQRWKQAHSSHPALNELGPAYANALTGGYADGQRLVVVLPRGGRFAPAAKAIREGIDAAAHADTGGHRPTLNFSTSRALNASHVRQRAAAGADYLIGPLQKSSVDRLLASGSLPIPVLALNQATRTDKRTDNLFQFSLSPENEASEAAAKASSLGARRAAVLHPDSAWGRRMAAAFSTTWRGQGGTLERSVHFNPAWSSYEKTLGKLLGSDMPDVVFLVATDAMAHKIYPALRKRAGASLKVIATSHVYSGVFRAAKDKTLAGLYFIDIPWMVEANPRGPLARTSRRPSTDPLARLFAMGVDAYRLAPRLPTLASNPGSYYAGLTGGLSLDPGGRVQRQLALARFTVSGIEVVGATSAATP